MAKIPKETIDTTLQKYLSGSGTREIAMGLDADARIVTKIIDAYRKNEAMINKYVPGENRMKSEGHFTNQELIYLCAHNLRGIPHESTAKVLCRDVNDLFGRTSPSAFLHLLDTALAYRYLAHTSGNRYYEKESESVEHVLDNVGMMEILHDYNLDELENVAPKRVRALAAYFAYRDKDKE